MSVSPDGKQFTLKDLSTKKPVVVALSEASAVRRLPPELAARLARRMNAGARPGNSSGTPNTPPAAPPPAPDASSDPSVRPGMRAAHDGDVSQMIDRLPAMSLSDLKPGDAVVVSGSFTQANDQLIATHVVAGVEPILQSVPARSRGGDAAGGDWGLGEISAPQQ